MPGRTYKVIELVGTSDKGVTEAIASWRRSTVSTLAIAWRNSGSRTVLSSE